MESVGQVREVERRLRERLGDEVDVLSGQRNAAAIAAEALERIRSDSVFGALLSLSISALPVPFTMALIKRERTRVTGKRNAAHGIRRG